MNYKNIHFTVLKDIVYLEYLSGASKEDSNFKYTYTLGIEKKYIIT